jgi:6-phosphogluconolactonase
MGANPAHLSLDNTGKFLLVANYSGGNFAVFPIDCDGLPGKSSAFIQNTGSGPNTARQEGPHAHYISVSKDNRFIMVADLGIDKVVVYPFNGDNGALDADNPVFIQLEPGSGPRHFTFGVSGQFLYVLNELTSNIASFRFDTATAETQSIQTITTLPADFIGDNYCAEIITSADGRFIYASNRGHNSIAQFNINPGTGILTPVDWFATGGQMPRNFAIDPTGKWLFAANQNSDNIVLFRIDQETGRLIATKKSIKVKMPVCVRFLEEN